MRTEAQRGSRREADKRWRVRNPDKVAAKNAAWRADNPDRVRAANAARDKGMMARLTAEWNQRNPEKRAEGLRNWRRNNPAAVLLKSMKQGKRPVSLSLEDVQKLIEPMVCSVTGEILRWDIDRSRDPLAPSVDRIDTSKGYVCGNVRLVSLIYNLARNSYSDGEVVKYLIEPMARLKVEGRGGLK